MTAARKHNLCFDQLKGIACIAVVFMHCEFPGVFGVIVQCLTRWSVPLFFAIAGYFFRKETVEECFRKAKHILSIILWAVAFYLVFTTIEHLIVGDLAEYIRAEFTVKNIGAFLLFNGQVFVAGHLWFLFALLYVYFAYALLIKTGATKYNKHLCVLLFVCHFVLAYGGYLSGHALKAGFYRNWLFDGLPSFLLGKMLYTTETDGLKKPSLLILGGLVLALIERAALGRDFSMHIGSIITLIGMIIWAKREIPINVGARLSKIGGGYFYVCIRPPYRRV